MPARLFERLRAALNPLRHDGDFAQELETHSSLLEHEYTRQGKSPQEARRLARLALGTPASLRDQHSEVRGLPWVENLWRDGRFALRSFRRDAGFALFTIVIGALGIGVSTAIFSIVNTMLLRPLPVREPASLVWIAKYNHGQAGDRSLETIPVKPFLEFREKNRSFADIAAFFAFYEPDNRKMTGGGEAERLTGVPVSDNFFRVLGVSPLLGRELTAAECQANLPAVVLNEGFWRRRFHSDPNIVGRTLTLDNRPLTVVGVMPFDFGSMFAPGVRVDIFTPLPLTNDVNRMGNTLSMIGRLRPGVTLREALAEADVLTPPIGANNNRAELRFTMRMLDDRVRGEVRPALLLLAGAAFVVMLVLCANVSHMQLARSAARSKEVSIRVALGAGRGRVIQQLLTESLILFGASAALGMLCAISITRMLSRSQSVHWPFKEAVGLDAAGFAFTVVVAMVTGVICGLAPALQLPVNLDDSLKESARSTSGNRRQRWLRSAFVVTEIAFSCALLFGSGLLLESLRKVMDVHLGFQPQHAASLRIDPAVPSGPARSAYFDDLLGRVRGLPGIGAAGMTDVIPLGGNRSWNVGAKETSYSIAHPPPDAFVRIVSDGYLAAMGIPLRAGRDLEPRDREGSTPVVLLNETLARTLWPGQNAVGKTVKGAGPTARLVVGVVADVRHLALEQGSGNEFYVPMRQSGDYASVYLVFRSAIPPASAVAAVREAVRPLEPTIPTNAHRIFTEVVDGTIASRRMTTAVLSGFAGFTVLLAALGIFGLVSYTVTQRRQEIGIRMALGATTSLIQAEILKETLRLTGLGLALGIVLSLAGSRSLGALLYGVEKREPLTLISVCGLVAMIGVAAGYVPSLRASRTEPTTALRVS